MPVAYPERKHYKTGEIETPERVIFKGCVFETREKNYHDDSDFYAVVWDKDKQLLTTEYYDTTRAAGGGNAWADATDETYKEMANRYRPILADRMAEKDAEAAAEESKAIIKGRKVRVNRGRKVPKGTEGIVFWVGETTSYGYYTEAVTKIGIALDDGKETITKNGRTYEQHKNVAWTYDKNCDVIDPIVKETKTAEQYLAELNLLPDRRIYSMERARQMSFQAIAYVR